MTTSTTPIRENVIAARRSGSLARKWEEAWAAELGEGRERDVPALTAEVIQTHYKPHERARLLVDGKGVDSHGEAFTQMLYVQFYPVRDVARSRLEASSKKRPLRSNGPAIFEIPSWNAAAWALPNGPKMRFLRSFTSEVAARRFARRVGLAQAEHPNLGVPELLRYVPRKRALLLWDLPESPFPVYVKVYAPGGDVAAIENMRRLEEVRPRETLGFRIPRIIVHGAHRRAVLMEGLAGRPFTSRFGELAPADFEEVGRVLASFHGCGAKPARCWSGDAELHALRRGALDLASVLPDCDPPIPELVDALARAARGLEFPCELPIHANMQGDQILVGGEMPGLVDWDDLTLGDPLFDLGRLMAHVVFIALRRGLDPGTVAGCLGAMEEAYVSRSGHPVHRQRLRWHLATALVLRAKISSLRMLPDGWQEEIRRSVSEAARILAGKSPYSSW